ncbi:hypothetical protein VTK56DRAFT_2858 [Thermocarpiscus australiensis]
MSLTCASPWEHFPATILLMMANNDTFHSFLADMFPDFYQWPLGIRVFGPWSSWSSALTRRLLRPDDLRCWVTPTAESQFHSHFHQTVDHYFRMMAMAEFFAYEDSTGNRRANKKSEFLDPGTLGILEGIRVIIRGTVSVMEQADFRHAGTLICQRFDNVTKVIG